MSNSGPVDISANDRPENVDPSIDRSAIGHTPGLLANAITLSGLYLCRHLVNAFEGANSTKFLVSSCQPWVVPPWGTCTPKGYMYPQGVQ